MLPASSNALAPQTPPLLPTAVVSPQGSILVQRGLTLKDFCVLCPLANSQQQLNVYDTSEPWMPFDKFRRHER